MAFDGPAFIRHVAERLVAEFRFSSGAGTPGLVGAAKEHPARRQLELLMPGGVSVGSGIIIDSYGGVSKQQDIVIYESLCPVFTTNGTPEATYYPVEGVVAVGEVKSIFGKSELKDSLKKIESVKSLDRRADPEASILFPSRKNVPFRKYCDTHSMEGTDDEQFDQYSKSLDQVFGFILCQKFATLPTSILSNFASESSSINKLFLPNLVVSLEDGFISPHNSLSGSITRSVSDGDGLIFCAQPTDAFAHLLTLIRAYLYGGRTVSRMHYERYFRPLNSSLPTYPVAAKIGL